MVVEKFQIYSVKITGKYINTFVSQKIEFVNYSSCRDQNCPPGFYHYLTDRRKSAIPLKQCLQIYFLPSGTG